jgi:hypothetical protein
MRSTYQRINAGDIDGFGNLMADDFEHDFVENPALGEVFLPRRRGRSPSSETCSSRFPTCT